MPEARLGGSFAGLKAHVWFEKFDWDLLLDKKLKPPYIPPKEKMMLDRDIQKMESASKRVIDEIETDLKG